MTLNLSKTQIDRLGNRLKKASLIKAGSIILEEDLRRLDEYRRSFGAAYETVVQTIREQLGLEPTGRPAKSTTSILEKLLRESIRLSQIQDIAGCRVIVDGVLEQETVIASLREVFRGASVIDRRVKPSYGYRAVHVIPKIEGKTIEIQVRTKLQHLWAELSEKLSDVIDPSIKYGGGDGTLRSALEIISKSVTGLETTEESIPRLRESLSDKPTEEEIEKFKQNFVSQKKIAVENLSEAIIRLEKAKRNKR